MPEPQLTDWARRERQRHDQAMDSVDFAQAPFTVAWEVTRACPYACVHCRADAQYRAHPAQLTHDEGIALIDRLADFGSPILVFTGGDPMMRPDLFELIEHATSRGLRCSLTPTATAKPTVERLRRAQEAGVRRIALSLDAPTPEVHDAFRQVNGSWQRTMRILANAHEIGLSAQINTTVARHNVHLLPEMVQFVEQVGAVQWSLFFLVPTGRAQTSQMISADEHERVFEWLYDLSRRSSFDIKATAAPMYRRVAIQRRQALGVVDDGTPFQGAGFSFGDGLNRPRHGVNDGRGFLFISHIGEIMPSGFLPISVGTVRERDVVDAYRHDPLFRALRDPSQLKGKCGVCPFRVVCGGQRGRAWAVTGDPLESDPACAYLPEGWTPN